MTKETFILLPLLLLTACTTVTQYHESCMTNPRFVQRAACVQSEIGNDPNLRGDPLAQEYVLTAVDLAHKVQAHQLTDDQAQLQLTHKLNEINHIRAENLAAQDYYGSPGFVQPVFIRGYYRH